MTKFKIYVSEREKEIIESRLRKAGLLKEDEEFKECFGAEIVVTPKIEVEIDE
jgi:chorismate mutase